MSPEEEDPAVLWAKEYGDPFELWRQRFPDSHTDDPDPRDDRPCTVGSCQTFAWRGYDGLCGWCHAELWAEVSS